MQTYFSYHIPQNKALFKLALIFGFAGIAFYFIKFDIHNRTYHLNNYSLFFGGIMLMTILLLVAFLLKIKSNRSKQNANKLFLSDTYFQFPVGKKEFIKANYVDINSVINIGNKYNGDILQIKARNHAFTTMFIQANGFATREQFIEFESLLRSNLI